MGYPINGLKDIHTAIVNERKLGGAIELEQLKLRNGALYNYPVIIHVDYVGQRFYHVTFVTESGEKMIIHVDDVELMKNPEHKNICQINNAFVRKEKIEERMRYLKRFIEINEGNKSQVYVEELERLVKDIGDEIVRKNFNIASILKEDSRSFRIA